MNEPIEVRPGEEGYVRYIGAAWAMASFDPRRTPYLIPESYNAPGAPAPRASSGNRLSRTALERLGVTVPVDPAALPPDAVCPRNPAHVGTLRRSGGRVKCTVCRAQQEARTRDIRRAAQRRALADAVNADEEEEYTE